MTLLLLVLILSFLILIHELGHFLSARFFGMKVEEFGIGYPPKAKTLFWRNGVEFTLNWLPFGGFVRLAGETLDKEEERDKEDMNMFYNQVWWKKLVVILAGAAVNFTYGVAAFGLLFSVLGIPETFGVEITEISANSPAEEAGLQPGEEIRSLVLDGETITVENTEQFVSRLKDYSGKTVGMVVAVDDQQRQVEVYVREPGEIPAGDGAVGVGIQAKEVQFVKYPWWERPFRGAYYGLTMAIDFSRMVLGIFGEMIAEIFTQAKVPEDVVGPLGIVHQAYKQDIFEEGLVGMLNWSAVLSIQLAIINVLPIPALDGGRAVFIVVERFLGKRYRLDYEHKAIVAGMVFLFGLIILISIKDLGLIWSDVWGR